MIGIIGALEEEIVMFKHDMEITKVENIAKCEYVSGKLNGQDVVITRCGMGKVNAASCTTVMIERYHPDFIINTGVGGSLDKNLKVLDIMIATDVVQHDYNLVPLGYKIGQVDNFETAYFICDEKVNAAIKKTSDKYNYTSYFSRFATGDRFVEDDEDKRNIVNLFNAQVCDMESAAIAQVCTLHNVRFSNIRTISDSGSDNAMQFEKFLKVASTHSVIVIEEVIEKASELI